MKTFVVIPAFNEEERIEETIKETLKYCENIIVVDDGSNDKTFEKALSKGVSVIRLCQNEGKSEAMKVGIKKAISFEATHIIFLDADGQHSPKIIPLLEQAIKTLSCDLIFTSRKINKQAMPLRKRLGNWFLTKMINLLHGAKITDSQCGLKIIDIKCYYDIKWDCKGYLVESAIAINSEKEKLKYAEIPIETVYLDENKGTNIMTGFKIMKYVIMRCWK